MKLAIHTLLLLAFVLVAVDCGTNAPAATPQAQGAPAPATAEAPAAGLGSPAAPRACDARTTAGTCTQLLPAHFAAGNSDQDSRASCGAPDTYISAACPTEGTMGHCVMPDQDQFFYPGVVSVTDAVSICNALSGHWTAAR